ncbi:AAA family ATPase [Microbacterium trichothecenolyticum]|uniref:ATPase, T2SS/T4P/T4SS family n=1 Tax=Microbacterium trichothecenolyticum TaxID=69370 RepID=UPI00286ADB0A|nr:AAA family ATPase [Microbacterium trichothecenolyticum]
MRGGLERWKRGAESRGVRHAIAYALEGVCDAHLVHSPGAAALEAYSGGGDASVTRFVVQTGTLRSDELSASALRVWLSGHDPVSGEERGKTLLRPEADLLLDGTLNHPKSYSIAALLHPELAAEFEALQDRIRDRVILLWQKELNARRGHGGSIRESISRVEVVELQHRRSRALDPHIHRHLWLNVKVLGEDGKWSNVDSRVAMKFHTVVNAEGELAARTDPRWVGALARHGYTIGDDGEIAELAAAVAPFSRRSAQIEANRARLIAEWTRAHGGLQPSIEVLQQIDRRAWAISRPNKPTLIDEDSWEAAVRDELIAIDPLLAHARGERRVRPTPPESVDLDQVARAAVVDADDRSRASNGRFSQFDLRAGALRALATTGMVAERAAVDDLLEDIVSRAGRHIVRLTAEPDIPGHIKALMATDTMRLKVRIAGRFDAIAIGGRALLPDELRRVAASVEGLDLLDASQSTAACAIAGTHGLVAVTGPAGAGKTTMLRAAYAALNRQRRRMLVVAPTRKAASVAARETGAEASSLHALLYDYGYRWSRDANGAQVWQRLAVGDADPKSGSTYGGPRRFGLRPGDRIVVDEAGMLDLQTADALTELALQTGAGVAMVGDTHQALPVGHTGAMETAIRHASASVELDTVHRFRDAEYAALTLRLRHPRDRDDALQIAEELAMRGHLRRVDNIELARAAMVECYLDGAARGSRVALVCGSNSEADAINSDIQQIRVEAGELDPTTLAWGRDEQRLLVGDMVQTRRNDPRTGVENRAQWIVSRIDQDKIDLVSPADAGERRRISRDYALDHVVLAYASTVHGIQGETADTAIVGPDVDAAGLYVGLTRGRHYNEAVVIGRTDETARDRLAATMLRGTTEVTINESLRAAEAELRRAARHQASLPQLGAGTEAQRPGISM